VQWSRRALRLVVGLFASFGSWVLAGWASVNGPNYDAWTAAFLAFAVVALVAGTVAAVAPGQPGHANVLAASLGAVVALICGEISIHWFGDGSPASRAPTLLAWTTFVALTLGAAALARPWRPQRPLRLRRRPK
jgi:hypothetical protein